MKVSVSAQGVGKALLGLAYGALLWRVFLAWRDPATRGWFEPHGLEQVGRAWLAGPGGAWTVTGGYALASLMGIPVAVLVVAGVLVFGPGPGMACAWAGLQVGAVVAYGMGRWMGATALDRVTGRWVPLLRRALHRHGFGAVVVVRVVPLVPFMVGNLSFGALRTPFGHYLMGTALGLLPITVLTSLFLGRLTGFFQHRGAGEGWWWAGAALAAVAAGGWAMVRRQRAQGAAQWPLCGPKRLKGQ